MKFNKQSDLNEKIKKKFNFTYQIKIKKNMVYLNLGCGNVFHEDWINIDHISSSKHVKQYDISKNIPLEDDSVDFLYHSHVLEHLTKKNGLIFLKECHRVLKKEGVIRIVVPDLKTIAEEYLKAYNNVKTNNSIQNEANYNWMLIEMIDQLAREKSGGEMLKYWSQDEIKNPDFLENRIGKVYLKYRNFKEQIANKPLTVKEKILNFFLKKIGLTWDDYETLKFSKLGERHKWMYDDFSLSNTLKDLGFTNIKIQTGNTSYNNEWYKYSSLDMDQDEKLRKPDSLIIEALK